MLMIQVFGMWGKTAINVFTLITGYFTVTSQVTPRKLLRLVLEVYFYTFVFYVIFLVTGYEAFSLKELVRSVLVVAYSAGSSYTGSMIAMMLFAPFANILARAMSKRQYQLLLTGLLIYFTGLSTFLKHETFTFVFWLMAVYLMGGYLRRYPPKWDTLKVGVIGTVGSILLMVGSIAAVDFIGSRFGITEYYFFVNDANKLLAVTASVSIFVMFKNWKLRYVKLINIVASTTFGVLLIHANSAAMRRFLWVDLFRNAEHYTSASFLPYACGVVLLVYAAAVCIDLARIRWIEEPLFERFDRFSWIDKPLW